MNFWENLIFVKFYIFRKKSVKWVILSEFHENSGIFSKNHFSCGIDLPKPIRNADTCWCFRLGARKVGFGEENCILERNAMEMTNFTAKWVKLAILSEKLVLGCPHAEKHSNSYGIQWLLGAHIHSKVRNSEKSQEFHETIKISNFLPQNMLFT